MNIRKILDATIEDFYKSNINIDGTGNNLGQFRYLEIMKDSYSETINDCLGVLPGDNFNICELGSFLGIVAKSLKSIGHNVIACDIPYFFEREEIKNHFKRSSINSLAFNLRDNKIPINSSSQDMVIACEIIEHLNFNPLPIIKEINRILKIGGYFYLATPNANSLLKKIIYLFFGKQPSFKISQLYQQLDPSQNMIVGLHWREYSLKEVKDMILPFGFEIVFVRLIGNVGVNHGGFLKNYLKNFLFNLPGCKPNQIIMFRKIYDSDINLHINKDS